MTRTELLNEASQTFCPNLDCPVRGKVGAGKIVSHGKQRKRSKCQTCGKTFSARQGTLLEGLRKPEELSVIVGTLLASGCPPQAIVQALQLEERTVARGQKRAGAPCSKVHEAYLLQGKLDLVQVHADEIRGNGCKMLPWMALALMVSTRLWVGGVVSLRRDRHLAAQLLQMVKACCCPWRVILVLTDGWSAYPTSIRRAFRDQGKRGTGCGRSRLQAGPTILIGTVIKRAKNKRVVEVLRRMTQGCHQAALALLQASRGGNALNTAFIERLHATFRQRLACLTRRGRHAARRLDLLEAGRWLGGCTYTLCGPHHEVSRRGATAQDRRGVVWITPAMASGWTDHVWSVRELLSSRIAPPPWTAPKQRGRPRKAVMPATKPLPAHPRPLLRLRKGVLCPSTR